MIKINLMTFSSLRWELIDVVPLQLALFIKESRSIKGFKILKQRNRHSLSSQPYFRGSYLFQCGHTDSFWSLTALELRSTTLQQETFLHFIWSPDLKLTDRDRQLRRRSDSAYEAHKKPRVGCRSYGFGDCPLIRKRWAKPVSTRKNAQCWQPVFRERSRKR